MNLPIGFMQGRLSPVPLGIYQRFPSDWKSELLLARFHKFSHIEWIIDSFSESFNPLLSSDLLPDLKASIDSELTIYSVCVDIILEKFNSDTFNVDVCSDLLRFIISNSRQIGVTTLVLPFIENLSLRNSPLRTQVVLMLNNLEDCCVNASIKLALELDLSPAEISSLFHELNSDYVGINYDTGNSAAFGFDIEDEFSAYSNLILDVHIKDRLLNGPPVLLGSGNANLRLASQLIKDLPFKPIITLQAFRNHYDTNLLILQRNWFEYLLHS